MLGQSTLNLKSRILDCFDFLQKSRNDGVGGIIIAIRFAFYAVIARVLPEAIQKIKSFCFVLLLQNEESPYPLDSNPQSEILPIRSWLIYFTHCIKSRVFGYFATHKCYAQYDEKVWIAFAFATPRNDDSA